MKYLDIVFKILGFLIDRSRASEETRKRFVELANAAQKDQLITQKTQDKFNQQLREVLEVQNGPRNSQ